MALLEAAANYTESNVLCLLWLCIAAV